MNSTILQSVVVKIGTEVITAGDGHLETLIIASLAQQIAAIKERIQKLVIVTSGAVAAGRGAYDLPQRSDESIDEKRFLASVGQPLLLQEYIRHLTPLGVVVGQGLLEWSHFDSRLRRRRILSVLEQSFSASKPTVPILNENDVTADEEFSRFTDNDHLAYEVARMIRAQRVVFLTSVNGIQRDLNDPETAIPVIPFGSREHRKYIRRGPSKNGRGGMHRKDIYCTHLARHGATASIAYGCEPQSHVLTDIILEGKYCGTTYLPREHM